MDENPIARRDAFGTHQGHADIALHSGNLYFRKRMCIVYDLYNFPWNTKTHCDLLFLCSSLCKRHQPLTPRIKSLACTAAQLEDTQMRVDGQHLASDLFQVVVH